MSKKWITDASHNVNMVVFHLDPDCRRLKNSCREAPESLIEWHDLRPCKWCDPENDPL